MLKRLFAIIISVTMILATCACAAAEPNNASDKKDTEVASEVTTEKEDEVKEDSSAEQENETETTSTGTELYSNEEKGIKFLYTTDKLESVFVENGFTKEQMESLYNYIAESVQTNYLDSNEISLEDFVWPDIVPDITLEMNSFITMFADEYNYYSEKSVEEIKEDILLPVYSDVDENTFNLLYSILLGTLDWYENTYDSQNREDFYSTIISLPLEFYSSVPQQTTNILYTNNNK